MTTPVVRTPVDRWFNALSWAEGLTLVLLYFVAMPLKYGWGMPIAVRVMGGLHGFAFTALVVSAVIQQRRHGWSGSFLAWAIISANLPLGCAFFHATTRPAADGPIR